MLSNDSTLRMLPKLKRLQTLNALAMLHWLRQLGIAWQRASCFLRPIAANTRAIAATRNRSYLTLFTPARRRRKETF